FDRPNDRAAMTRRESDVQSKQMFRRGLCFFLTSVISVAAGCSNNSSSSTTNPTAPTSTVYLTEAFSGTLDPGGQQSKQFSIGNDGTMSVTLASLTMSSNGPALTTPVGLGVGVPNADNTACVLSSSLVTAPSLQAQISVGVTKATATYCVGIGDPGNNLKASVTFVIKVVHP